MVFPPDERSVSRASLVHAVVQALSSDAPFDAMWDRCASPLLELAGAVALTVMLREPDGDRIVYHSADASPATDVLAADCLLEAAAIEQNLNEFIQRAIPIRFAGALIGAVALQDCIAFDDDARTLLDACALSIGARLHHERALRAAERYAELALTDGLTGIPNRRRFDEALSIEWQRAGRGRLPLTALVVDIDHFKAFNDRYGHDNGDLCLRRLARALADAVQRPGDLLARYGGEEFVALLPGTDLEGGIVVAESLRVVVQELNVENERSVLGRVSVSIGVATLVPDTSQARETLFRAADDALYQAKRSGRDRVCARGYASDANAARHSGTIPTNLPLQLTPLVGRRDEVAAILSGIRANRLLTIVGPGGTGKTRAALQAANEALGDAAGGVWFVDLSPLRDGALVAGTIGELFDLWLPMGDAAVPALAAALANRDLLIVLDNCEHVLDGVAATAAALLHGCPRVRLLATSREPLELGGEYRYRLPLLDAEDAAALFVERARAVKPDMAFDSTSDALVTEICRRLDGIALAIELAASRVAMVSLGEIASQLHERFGLLAGGDRSALPRQQTMRATLDWSFGLLDAAETIVFRRAAIFVGSFTAEAAMTVCADDEIDATDVFAALSQLVRKSLLIEDPASGENRYRFLDTMLAYARERLALAGERAALARRHAEWVNDAARAGERLARRMSSLEWVAQRRPDLDNDRAALTWALGPNGDALLGASIAGALVPLFVDVAAAEGTDWSLRALEALGEDPPPDLAAMLCTALSRSNARFNAVTMRAYGERAVAYARESGEPMLLSRALTALAQIVGGYQREDREFADACAVEAIELARAHGDAVDIALALRTRGLTSDLADIVSKRAVLEESLQLLRVHGSSREVASGLTWLSELEFSVGDHERAYVLGRDARRAAEAAGNTSLLLLTIVNLAYYALAANDVEAARIAAEEGLRMARELRDPTQFTNALQALACASAAAGNAVNAARLLGFCDARYGPLHSPRQADQCEDMMYRRFSAKLRLEMGEAAFARALAEGGALSEGEAVAAALSPRAVAV
jgi:diguanylate cyclase (GGDEF)-like protein